MDARGVREASGGGLERGGKAGARDASEGRGARAPCLESSAPRHRVACAPPASPRTAGALPGPRRRRAPSTTPSSASRRRAARPTRDSTCGLAQSAGGIGRLRASGRRVAPQSASGALGRRRAGEVGADGAPARGRLPTPTSRGAPCVVHSDDGDAAARRRRRASAGASGRVRGAAMPPGGDRRRLAAPSVRTSRAMIWRRASSASAEVLERETSRSAPAPSPPRRGVPRWRSRRPHRPTPRRAAPAVGRSAATGSCVDRALSLSWRMRAYVPRSGLPSFSTVHCRGIGLASCCGFTFDDDLAL